MFRATFLHGNICVLILTKSGSGCTFRATFSQTHLVTLSFRTGANSLFKTFFMLWPMHLIEIWDPDLYVFPAGIRVARWFVFKPKNPNLGTFWRVLQWKVLAYFRTIWSILRPLEIFYGRLVYYVVIWYFFPVLVSCTKKNLATLAGIDWILICHSSL
jgi:hypothetical protein